MYIIVFETALMQFSSRVGRVFCFFRQWWECICVLTYVHSIFFFNSVFKDDKKHLKFRARLSAVSLASALLETIVH
jgi:hypothetical protein